MRRERVDQKRVAFGEQPTLLVGPPNACQGLLQVHNPADNPVKLKQVSLRTADAKRLELRVGAQLEPKQSHELRVSLALPPGTPPGRYQASLEGADGQERPVTIEVLERRHTRCVPPSMSRGVRRGERFTVRATLVNEGNVPVIIPKRAALLLHPLDRGWPQHFHAAAATHGSDGYETFLNDFVDRWGNDEPPPGRARILQGDGLLAAQSGRVIEAELRLPERLRVRRRYQAVLRLADATLTFTLHVLTAEERAAAEEYP
jgi:hypothetical protein